MSGQLPPRLFTTMRYHLLCSWYLSVSQLWTAATYLDSAGASLVGLLSHLLLVPCAAEVVVLVTSTSVPMIVLSLSTDDVVDEPDYSVGVTKSSSSSGTGVPTRGCALAGNGRNGSGCCILTGNGCSGCSALGVAAAVLDDAD